MSKACMICWVKCTTCWWRWGKCNCWYTEWQKQLSNQIINDLQINDWRRWVLPELILSWKSEAEVRQDILDPVVDENQKTILTSKFDTTVDNTNLRCKYESNWVMARCILCWEIRFYKRWEPCVKKIWA